MTMQVEWLVPLLFFPSFIALWSAIVFLIAVIGGWRSLGERYAIRADEYTGERWHMRSGMMQGFARYNNVLTIGADRRGLYLSIFVLFRIGHPPLFIPWEHIQMQERRGWFFSGVDLDFTAVPGVHLTISKGLAEQVARAGGRTLPVFA